MRSLVTAEDTATASALDGLVTYGRTLAEAAVEQLRRADPTWGPVAAHVLEQARCPTCSRPDLAQISARSRPDLAQISPRSRPDLAHVSPMSRLEQVGQGRNGTLVVEGAFVKMHEGYAAAGASPPWLASAEDLSKLVLWVS